MKIKKKKKLIIAIIVVVVLAIFIIKITGGKKTTSYKIENPKRAKIVQTVEASGTINPVTQTSVGTQVSGRVEEIFVDYNSIIKKGQLLAVIDPSTYKSNVIQQEANLQKLESVFKNAERNYDRYKKLYAQELVAKSELDNAELDYLSANAQVVQGRASLDKAKIDLSYTNVVSPVDGIVISKEVELGQTVAASYQTPTLFLVAEDLTKMQIEVNISEADISKIKEGQRVDFNIDAYPTTTFVGKVSQVRNAATTISNVVTYTVVVSVDNDDLKLKPGMTANVSIITAEANNALSVPNQALRFVPPDNAKIKNGKDGKENQRKNFKGQGLWRQNKDGSIYITEVKTGITDGNRTEIISNEITENTPIIVASGVAGKGKNQQGRPRGPMGF
ncbi:MAG: efflux RND transporter periplasmic adaptor subunit [Elusimicrobiaceae bacterium]|nr:efflux RND transporter periplasmic adaptor subunit [Elusimicrobiaceae bacterium]